MTPDVIIGLLTGLLIASGLVNGFQWYTRFDSAKHWRQRTREESDARKAAELRSAQQIDHMLDRVSTSPRLEVAPTNGRAPIDPYSKKYIPDTPESDPEWNDFRGETDEDIE